MTRAIPWSDAVRARVADAFGDVFALELATLDPQELDAGSSPNRPGLDFGGSAAGAVRHPHCVRGNRCTVLFDFAV